VACQRSKRTIPTLPVRKILENYLLCALINRLNSNDFS
jgi:hypothetical protein